MSGQDTLLGSNFSLARVRMQWEAISPSGVRRPTPGFDGKEGTLSPGR